jgi:hypothetical protein
MEVLLAILFGAFVSTSVQVTSHQADCKARGFEPKACKVAEAYYKLGEKK